VCIWRHTMHIRFFVDSNITGYVYIRGQLLFSPLLLFYFADDVIAQISHVCKNFASVIKHTFRRYIWWIFKLFFWCDMCSIICFVKLNAAIVKNCFTQIRMYSCRAQIYAFLWRKLSSTISRCLYGNLFLHLYSFGKGGRLVLYANGVG